MSQNPYEFEEVKLESGGTLLYRQEDVKESILRFLFKAGGARYDPEGLEGRAHLLEHFLWKEDYSREIEVEDYKLKNLIELSPFTNLQSIYVKSAVPSKKLGNLFSLLSDKLVLNRNIDEEMLAKTKGEVIREMSSQQTDSRIREVHERRRSALFHEHSLARTLDVLGNPESLDRIDGQDLAKHYAKFINFSNLFVIAVTDIEKKKIKDLIEDLPLAEGSPVKYPKVIYNFPDPKEKFITNSKSEVLDSRSINGKTSLELHAIVASQDINFPWPLITRTLHEILYRELRLRQQLTYSVSVSSKHFRDLRAIKIIVRVSQDEVERVRNLIFSELENFRKNKELFQKIKKRVLYNFEVSRKSVEEAVDDSRENIAERDQIISSIDKKNEVERVGFKQATTVVKEWLNKDRILTHLMLP